jgi:putative transposase
LVKQVTFWGIILFVDKNDDRLRLCIDNHALNKISIKNNYPLPHIDDMLDQLNGAKYFIPIYVNLRYYQIRIANEDIEKMVMRTNYGLYEFLMMPFGCVMPHQHSQPS